MKKPTCTSWITGLSATLAVACHGQELLDTLDDKLFLQSPNGFIRSDLSGLLDLEGYYNDQTPPGLIIEDDKHFFNPRLSLFLDTKIGDHLYSLLQVRFDRGFDVGLDRDGDIRFDEYFLRYTPFDGPQLNIQGGKFGTIVGNYLARHLSWDNPFITAPVPYENVMTVGDQAVPTSPGNFHARKSGPDKKGIWNPIIWGPVYATGASVFGLVERFDYAFEVKNAALSSRSFYWDPTNQDFDNPNYSMRLGYRPNAAWSVGANASYGPYMVEAMDPLLPRGRNVGDYTQLTVGPDVSFAWHHLQIWAEAYAARFEIPNVADAETVAWYIEAKYKLTPQWFTALRWNQQLFDKIPNGLGADERWDRDMWRTDLALGYRYNRHWQAKLQYSYSHQNGPIQQGEQLLAAQLTLKF